MAPTDEFEPIVLLNDGESFSGLGGCELVVLTQEEAGRGACRGQDQAHPPKTGVLPARSGSS